MADKQETDAFTGTATTGHVWDGIRELNTPLPRWWLWLFYATIVWSVGYWVVYPSWPLLTSYTTGTFNWSSREAVVSDLEALKAQRGPMVAKLAAASLTEIVADQQLLEFARAQGRPVFGENCAPCHGAGGGGGKGYPNLNDNDWIWGGKLDEIAGTIRHGVRSPDPKTRQGPPMPAFGRDNMIKRADIEICWEGGARTELAVRLNARGPESRRLPEDTIELIRRLAAHHPDHQIAAILARNGHRTGTGLGFTASRVRSARQRAPTPFVVVGLQRRADARAA